MAVWTVKTLISEESRTAVRKFATLARSVERDRIEGGSTEVLDPDLA